jgi:hypothetical protein
MTDACGQDVLGIGEQWQNGVAVKPMSHRCALYAASIGAR